MIGIFLGYPKAGSTTIQAWLSGHPQVDYQACVPIGHRSTPGRLTVIGHEGLAIPHPAYSMIEQCDVDAVIPLMRRGDVLRAEQVRTCEDLSRRHPDAKSLLVTRGAVEFMRSIWLNYIKYGGTLGFAGYASECEPYFRAWLDYDFLVSLYQKHFGPERLLVLPAEMLFREPDRFWGAVGEFWELDPIAHGPERALNRARYDRSAGLVRRVSRGVKTLLQVLPEEKRRAAWSWYVYRVLDRGGLRGLERLPRLWPLPIARDFDSQRFAAWQRSTLLLNQEPFSPYSHHYSTGFRSAIQGKS